MTYLHILKGEMRKLWSNKAFLLLLLLLALMCGYVASRRTSARGWRQSTPSSSSSNKLIKLEGNL